jgi:hypothetical protein
MPARWSRARRIQWTRTVGRASGKAGQRCRPWEVGTRTASQSAASAARIRARVAAPSRVQTGGPSPWLSRSIAGNRVWNLCRRPMIMSGSTTRKATESGSRQRFFRVLHPALPSAGRSIGSKLRGSPAMNPSASTDATRGPDSERLPLSNPRQGWGAEGMASADVASAANPERGKPQALQSVSVPASGVLAG